MPRLVPCDSTTRDPRERAQTLEGGDRSFRRWVTLAVPRLRATDVVEWKSNVVVPPQVARGKANFHCVFTPILVVVRLVAVPDARSEEARCVAIVQAGEEQAAPTTHFPTQRPVDPTPFKRGVDGRAAQKGPQMICIHAQQLELRFFRDVGSKPRVVIATELTCLRV